MSTGEFQPFARYLPETDSVIFVVEDVASYRPQVLFAHITLLWHPSEQRLVGMEEGQMRAVYDRLKDSCDLGTFEEYMAHYETAVVTQGVGADVLECYVGVEPPELPQVDEVRLEHP